MELHTALRELVQTHGRSILDDATGFRGMLDDVLPEDQASTGDINLLVDAVRFDALNPLVAMIDGGADPQRAVEEAGLRLARNRGGDDHAASSWASAVLGYAVGKVPEAVVLRYRSGRHSSGPLPPPTQAPPPPVTRPPVTQAPTQLPPPPPAQGSWPPQQPQPQQPQQPVYPIGGYVPQPPKKKRSGAIWIAAVVAAIVVIAGGVTAVLLVNGKDEPKPSDTRSGKPDKPEKPKVDVAPAAVDQRYNALASSITAGASDCTAPDPATGEKEVVQCTIGAGTLRLVTYADQAALDAARANRLDYRAVVPLLAVSVPAR